MGDTGWVQLQPETVATRAVGTIAAVLMVVIAVIGYRYADPDWRGVFVVVFGVGAIYPLFGAWSSESRRYGRRGYPKYDVMGVRYASKEQWLADRAARGRDGSASRPRP